jgi:anhydro-N-acetylmuramic acid kinase
MSGTSLDGVDAALVELTDPDDPTTWNLREFVTVDFEHMAPPTLRAIAQDRPTTASQLSASRMDVARDYERAVREVCRQAGCQVSDLAYVAAHGVTLSHVPSHGHTLQLGAGAALAAWLGTVVVDDFRTADVALGGQGAPLAPVADLALRTSAREDRVVLNLGGIANATCLPAGATSLDATVAADVGPANLPLDLLCRRRAGEAYDAGGRRAGRGRVAESVVRSLLEADWVRQPLPRSFGREQFGEAFVDAFLDATPKMSLQDQLATLVAMEALAVRRFLEDLAGSWRRAPQVPLGVYVTGGGRHNEAVLAALSAQLPEAVVDGIDRLGISADAKEAFDFVLLGWWCLTGRAAGAQGITGAREAAVLGAVHAPRLRP